MLALPALVGNYGIEREAERLPRARAAPQEPLRGTPHFHLEIERPVWNPRRTPARKTG